MPWDKALSSNKLPRTQEANRPRWVTCRGAAEPGCGCGHQPMSPRHSATLCYVPQGPLGGLAGPSPASLTTSSRVALTSQREERERLWYLKQGPFLGEETPKHKMSLQIPARVTLSAKHLWKWLANNPT